MSTEVHATDSLWAPPPDVQERSRIGQWLGWLRAERDLRFDSYHDLWRWSVEELEAFWSAVWDYFKFDAHTPPRRVLASRYPLRASWFTGTTLNYAENLLGRAPEGTAVVARSQTREGAELTGLELRNQVARAQAGLRQLGVGVGDRVVAYVPNIPETLTTFLAAASLGAIFSACPPEFGPKAVVDRFAQIQPTVLLAVDGYRHRGRPIDRRDTVAAIRARAPIDSSDGRDPLSP